MRRAIMLAIAHTLFLGRFFCSARMDWSSAALSVALSANACPPRASGAGRYALEFASRRAGGEDWWVTINLMEIARTLLATVRFTSEQASKPSLNVTATRWRRFVEYQQIDGRFRNERLHGPLRSLAPHHLFWVPII